MGNRQVHGESPASAPEGFSPSGLPRSSLLATEPQEPTKIASLFAPSALSAPSAVNQTNINGTPPAGQTSRLPKSPRSVSLGKREVSGRRPHPGNMPTAQAELLDRPVLPLRSPRALNAPRAAGIAPRRR